MNRIERVLLCFAIAIVAVLIVRELGAAATPTREESHPRRAGPATRMTGGASVIPMGNGAALGLAQIVGSSS